MPVSQSANIARFFAGMLCAAVFLSSTASAQVVAYPAPPGLTTSNDFALSVNGTSIWVQKVGVTNDMVSMAHFSGEGSLSFQITASQDITFYTIRPKAKHIAATVNGKVMTFTVTGPIKLYLEINGIHFMIFASPLEVNPPKQGDAGVTYYGPGSYNTNLTLQSNRTIYLAGGAVVNGRLTGSNATNAKIMGRGILYHNATAEHAGEITGCSNCEINGIVMENIAYNWGFANIPRQCNGVRYINYKVLSFAGTSWGVDGLDPIGSSNITIDDCFIRSDDDCISIKSYIGNPNVVGITIQNSMMCGHQYSDGVTIGFEVNCTSVKDILVKNCDILYARGGGKSGGHSGFSIVLDGPAEVSNIRYEDIRLEEHVETKAMELICSDGSWYSGTGSGSAGGGANDGPGRIHGVYLKNISWENGSVPFVIKGYSSNNLVDTVTFEHCYVAGNLLTRLADANFQTNEFARNIRFLVASTIPDVPTLTSPVDGATGISTRPTLQWNAASGAETYQLQVSSSSNFATILFNDSTLTAPTGIASGLAANTAYYWRVRAANTVGKSNWSTARSFTTNTPTLTSITLTPANALVIITTTQQFTATALDQLGVPMSAPITFTVSGGGTISATGLFTAGSTAGGPYTVTASSGGKSATANLTIAFGCPTTNIASGKPVTVSSTWSSNTGANAVDGSTFTAWCSEYDKDPQWLQVDLGAPTSVCKVVVKQLDQLSYGSMFKIQVSNDASTWADIASQSGVGVNQTITLTSLNGVGRYVRYYGTARGNSWGYMVHEFEVYGIPTGSTVQSPQPKILQPEHSLSIARDIITIGGSARHSVAIIALSGAIVQRFSGFGSAEYIIDKRAPGCGTYLVEAVIDGRKISRRMIFR